MRARPLTPRGPIESAGAHAMPASRYTVDRGGPPASARTRKVYAGEDVATSRGQALSGRYEFSRRKKAGRPIRGARLTDEIANARLLTTPTAGQSGQRPVACGRLQSSG